MKINPVHALLEVLKQQSRAQAANGTKVKGATVEDALKQVRAQILDEASAKPSSAIDQIVAESRDTKFRLEMLEKLVSDKFDMRNVSARSVDIEEGLSTSEKPSAANLASSAATDALNQTAAQSHGRAWHNQPDLWNTAEAEFLKYHVTDPGLNSAEIPIGIAQKFTPTLDDIESALFKEGADPAEFAKMFMAGRNMPPEAVQSGFAPRLVPIAIGVLMLFTVAYLIL